MNQLTRQGFLGKLARNVVCSLTRLSPYSGTRETTLMICADLFACFSYEMGKSQYYPPSAPERSENRLFGMFHTSTPQHSKDVIMESLQDCHGTVRVVFASVARGWE